MHPVLWFGLGAMVGAAAALIGAFVYGRTTRRAMEQRFRDIFAGLSADALAANSERFLTMARESLSAQTHAGAAELDKRREQIDASIKQMTERLEAIRTITGKVETSRKEDYGQLAQRLRDSVDQVAKLQQATDKLRAALAHPQQRGAWAERMADDVLQVAGMIEGVNYTKQQTMADSGRRPDFTFNLPNGVKLNMDVKFPLDNYLKHIESDPPDPAAATAFVSDVRGQVRAIANREYIDPAAGTADFALMFIPNEQLFSFIQELDRSLLTEAAGRRVLFVGPLSLLAVLAVVRQAAEAANLSRQTDEALALIETFAKEWGKFKDEMDKLGGRIEAAQKAFERLSTTRTNVLERPIRKLAELRGAEPETEAEPQ